MDQEQQFLICDTMERPPPLHGERSTCDGEGVRPTNTAHSALASLLQQLCSSLEASPQVLTSAVAFLMLRTIVHFLLNSSTGTAVPGCSE